MAPLKEGLGRRVAGVRDLCPAVACGGGGEEGAAEHRARRFPRLPEHRRIHYSEVLDDGVDKIGFPLLQASAATRKSHEPLGGQSNGSGKIKSCPKSRVFFFFC